MEDAIFFPLRKNPAICFRLCAESLGKSTLLTLLVLGVFFFLLTPFLSEVGTVVEVDDVATVAVDDDDDADDDFCAATSF